MSILGSMRGKGSSEKALVISPVTVTGESTVPIGLSVSLTLSSTPGLSGASISTFKYVWNNGSQQTVSASNNAATISVSVPNDAVAGSTITLKATAIDNYGNSSKESSRSFEVIEGYVNKPNVAVPTSGSSVVIATGLTVQSSAFSVTGASDTHVSSSWRIKKNGSVIAQSLNNTTDKTSHTFSKSDLSSLSSGDSITIEVMHTGSTFGDSDWSDPITVTANIAIVTDSGRYIYRHANNKGSVLIFDMFGTTVNLFVADAQYRTKLPFASAAFDSSLTNFNQSESSNSWYLTASGVLRNQTDNPPVITDSSLQAMWNTGNPSLKNDLTARANCDVWMTHSQANTTSYAVGYARSLTSFSGIDKCDIPNEYELMVIFIEMNYIDSLDPTVNSYQAYALGNTKGASSNRWSFNSANYAWSSTESDSSYVRYVNSYGDCLSNTKTSTYGVVPVHEL